MYSSLIWKIHIKNFAFAIVLCVFDLFNGGLEIKYSQLENVDEVARLQSLEIRIFLKLHVALTTNEVYALLQKLMKSICLGCKKTYTFEFYLRKILLVNRKSLS